MGEPWRMTADISSAGTALFAHGWRSTRRAIAGAVYGVVSLVALTLESAPAAAADPAVQFMAKVGRELMAAARTRSPGVMSSVIQRYADVSYIGLVALGSYRNQLPTTERNNYYAGMVKFIAQYAATAAPQYPVEKVVWAEQSIRGAGGIMVDSTITLAAGPSYDVRWLLVPYGTSYKVRDASVLGSWMTPHLRTTFEGYITQNGGNPRALVAALASR